MIKSLQRVAHTVTINPDADFDDAVPTLRHRVECQNQHVDVTYRLALSHAGSVTLEIQGTYRVSFTQEATPIPELAQDTTWPYFRQDAAPSLQGVGFDVDDLLPILNPIAPLLNTVQPPVSPPAAIPSKPATDGPMWQGVFPHRFEVARGLLRSLDEVANKQRQWFWSVLRIYAALLLSDLGIEPERTRDGVIVEVFQQNPGTFQQFFERETGVRLEAWQELKEDADRVFFISLVRDLLVVIHDAVREDSANEVTAEVYDDYLQEMDEYIDGNEDGQLVELATDAGDESDVPHVIQLSEGRAKHVRELAGEVMNRPPLDENISMFALAAKVSRLAMGVPRYSTAYAEEAAGYFELVEKDGKITQPIRYVYSANDGQLEFSVEIDIGKEYFEWSNTEKEWLQHGDFPSLTRWYIHRAANEELPLLDEAALDAAVSANLWNWAPQAQTVGEVMACLPETLSETDAALLGSLAGIDLTVVAQRIDNPALLKQWAKRQDVRARVGVVLNPLCGADLLTALAHDRSRFVREAVAAHPKCPPSAWEELSVDGWQVQANLVEHQPLPVELIWRMVHSSNGEGRAAIAEKSRDLPGLFDVLANDAEPQVRLAVASNPVTPRALLELLRQDENEHVAELARTQLQ